MNTFKVHLLEVLIYAWIVGIAVGVVNALTV